MPELVVDASTMVHLLVGTPPAAGIERRLRGHQLVAPAHFDAEVLSALGRLERAGDISARQVSRRLERLESAPISRKPVAPLLRGAWRRRHNLRLVDALYVELSAQLGDAPLITTDGGLARTYPAAELM
jgi:predicted nucleic acid-binding protein